MARFPGSRRRPRPRRILNKTTIGFLVLALAASGMLWRMLRPYWESPGRPAPAAEVPEAAAGTVPLVRVVDGDTVRVRWRGEDTRVRLLRIDTPERGEPGFAEATAALRGLLDEGPVGIEFERPGEERRDRFGRLLAYVYAPGGRNASVEMVKLGYSRFYTEFGRGRFAAELATAEEQARRSGAGLWGPEGWNAR